MRDFFQRRGKFRPEQGDEDRADLQIPEDLWIKCPKCGELIYSRELDRSDRVCPKCAYHFRLRARERIAQVTDPGAEILIAYEMNGQPLGADHGSPFRIIVPHWYAVASVKWLKRIDVLTEPYAG